MTSLPKNPHLAVLGLGYVGLPLARLFAKKYPVVGFDTNLERVQQLKTANDRTGELSAAELEEVLSRAAETKGLSITSDPADLAQANTFIITVPTPVDDNNNPDFSPMKEAARTVSKVLKPGDVVIFESTVYPGATEEILVPVLEQSGLLFNRDFFAGYSPERVSPGDKARTVENIVKITAGSTAETADYVDALYRSVITAGTYRAPSIRVAEAAKVAENCQRDINIAFVNELAKIFNTLGIDTSEVLKAAGTKWNFLPFRPGLPGGHCIGVDPYYLAQKAMKHGYYPELILTGRRLNNSMGKYVAEQVVKAMIARNKLIGEARVLLLGFTFKENCPDVRNTKMADVVYALQDYGINVTICDPWAHPAEVKQQYGLECHAEIPAQEPAVQANGAGGYDAIILGVAHTDFLNLNLNLYLNKGGFIYDVKGVLQNADFRL